MKKVLLLIGKWSKESDEVKEFWIKYRKKKNFILNIYDVSTVEGSKMMDRYEVSIVPVTIIDEEIKFIGLPDFKKVEEIFEQEG